MTSPQDGNHGSSGGSGDKSTEKDRKGKKDKKPSNPNIVIPPKKPKLTKAERRALQEKQRAAKAAASGGQGGGGGGGKNIASSASAGNKAPVAAAKTSDSKVDPRDKVKEGGAKDSSAATAATAAKAIDLFSHLPAHRGSYDSFSASLECQEVFSCSTTSPFSPWSSLPSSLQQNHLHPSILELGARYRDGTVRGANARCKAMMAAFKQVIHDYQTPPGKLLSQDLDGRIKSMFQHFTTCRPHSVSMGNAFTFLKVAIANLDRDVSNEEAKDMLCDQIDAYVQERIVFAGEAIAAHALTKINHGDVLLVYGKSEVIENILHKAAKKLGGDEFRVIVVDSRPLMEGRSLLQSLRSCDINCTFIYLNAITYVMKEVTKVLLGAAALMSNGSVQSRVGTAPIALMAHSCNVPVLVCCETYKISYRVQLESITGNELGNPEDIANTGEEENILSCSDSVLGDWKTTDNLKLLNITYDLTPSEYVSGIVTELGILPPTSVAVLLREMNPQDNNEGFR